MRQEQAALGDFQADQGQLYEALEAKIREEVELRVAAVAEARDKLTAQMADERAELASIRQQLRQNLRRATAVLDWHLERMKQRLA